MPPKSNAISSVLLFPILFSLAACEDCPSVNYLSFTHYKLENYQKKQTPTRKIKVYTNDADFNLSKIDLKTQELQDCLGIDLNCRCFVVLIPDDWFYSPNTDQQLLPYAAPVKYCNDKNTGFPDIPKDCEGVVKPTEECPLTCNWRVATQQNYIIVTVPNLILYKAELARMFTEVNNVWSDPSIAKCLN